MRALSNSPITPVHLSLGALVAGLAAAFAIARGSHADLAAGAILLQLKNVLDTADGHLARARGRTSFVGRYLDSLVDFVINVASHAALAVALVRRGWTPALAWPLAGAAALSALLQCSVYVHATVTYLERAGLRPVSRADERAAPPPGGAGGREPARLVRVLHSAHVLLYGWQDEIARRLDRAFLGRLARTLAPVPAGEPGAAATDSEHLHSLWYDDRRALTALSAVGLGSALAAMSLALLLDRPALYLVLAIAAGNAYVLVLYPLREARVRRAWRNRGLSHQAGSFFRQPPPA